MKHDAYTRSQRGAVAVEFLIVFPTVFFLVLGVAQLALLYAADILVEHAAFQAARAAIVVLPAGHVLKRPKDAPDTIDAAPNDVGNASTDPLESSARRLTIRHAAAYVMAAISPDVRTFLQGARTPADVRAWVAGAADRQLERAKAGSLRKTFREQVDAAEYPGEPESVGQALDAGHPFYDAANTSWYGVFKAGLFKYGYATFATAVAFPAERGYRTSFSPHEPIRVRVSYLFRCGVPLVNGVICKAFRDLPFEARLELADGDRALANAALPGSFLLLRAEAVMPNQGV